MRPRVHAALAAGTRVLRPDRHRGRGTRPDRSAPHRHVAANRALLLLAAAGAAVALASGTAQAAPRPVAVAGCTLSTANDPLVAGVLVAEVHAAVLLADDTSPYVQRGSVTCLLRVDEAAADVAGPVATGVAVAAGVTTFAEEANVVLCTRVDLVGGPALYLSANQAGGGWSADDSGCWQTVRGG